MRKKLSLFVDLETNFGVVTIPDAYCNFLKQLRAELLNQHIHWVDSCDIRNATVHDMATKGLQQVESALRAFGARVQLTADGRVSYNLVFERAADRTLFLLKFS